MNFRLQTGLLSLSLPLAMALSLPANGTGADPCKRMAFEAHRSCLNEASSDFWLARALCSNLSDPAERVQCTIDAFSDYLEARHECTDIRGERLALCDDLGGGFYEPAIDPANFVPVIDNPYLPLLPGTTWTYENQDEDEIIVVTVTDDTIDIMGVECTVVHDVVTIDGEIAEDTFDWFAQDLSGNVWYFGELSFEYEDGEISGLDGSWKAGEDGAHAGIVMQAAPQIGMVYRQEFLLREAEDVGAILGTSARATVPYGAFTGCLQTEDYSPLEPGVLENKFYAPGVGLVLETDPDSGQRVELISVVYH